jgi:hypothetical protein
VFGRAEYRNYGGISLSRVEIICAARKVIAAQIQHRKMEHPRCRLDSAGGYRVLAAAAHFTGVAGRVGGIPSYGIVLVLLGAAFGFAGGLWARVTSK